MAGGELEIVDGAAAGAWIGPELGGEFGAVALQVPRRYEACARILHPVTADQGILSWSEVAATTGRRVHPEVQWHALVGSTDFDNFDGALWDEGSPERGDLDARALEALLNLLRGFTSDPEHCFFAIWAGFNWGSFGWKVHEEDGRTWTEPFQGPSRSTHDLSWCFPPEQAALPELDHGTREYKILAGPLEAALRIAGSGGEDGDEEAISSNSPQMIWPADRAWFVASEIDFDSTLVGGSEEVVAAILAAPGLEAWPVAPDSSLAADADHVNPLPGD